MIVFMCAVVRCDLDTTVVAPVHACMCVCMCVCVCVCLCMCGCRGRETNGSPDSLRCLVATRNSEI